MAPGPAVCRACSRHTTEACVSDAHTRTYGPTPRVASIDQWLLSCFRARRPVCRTWRRRCLVAARRTSSSSSADRGRRPARCASGTPPHARARCTHDRHAGGRIGSIECSDDNVYSPLIAALVSRPGRTSRPISGDREVTGRLVGSEDLTGHRGRRRVRAHLPAGLVRARRSCAKHRCDGDKASSVYVRRATICFRAI